jgi:hypothetical protein
MSMGTITHLTSTQGLYIPDTIGTTSIRSGSTNTVSGGSNIPTPTSYIDRLELKMYKQSIRIIQLENKLDSEECENLKKMLESNDEASIILAKEIIDNLETA